MGKDLSELSLEELWALFPIFLVPHRERWAQDYAEMEPLLRRRLAQYPALRISHIGSTAIPGIWAKDIVDILAELPEGCDMEAAAAAMEAGGFTRMSTAPDRISLHLGYTEAGFAERVFHLHLRFAGDNDELYFRDYLRDHPSIAKEYEAMKLRLWREFEHNRDGYTDAKTAFIRKWTAEARRAYPDRY